MLISNNFAKNNSGLKVMLICIILGGCAVNDPIAQQNAIMSYVHSNNRPDFVKDALLQRRPALGMNISDIQFLYGNPIRINRASYGDQYVFSQMCAAARPGNLFQDTIYVYFIDGVVSDWQVNSCIY